MMNDYQMVFAIVNSGFADSVMDTAKSCGASGGTIFNARGSARNEAEQLFGISISEEKEIVMIIVPTSIKDQVLKGIYDKVGLKTPGAGIAFSLPVESVIGFTPQTGKHDESNH